MNKKNVQSENLINKLLELKEFGVFSKKIPVLIELFSNREKIPLKELAHKIYSGIDEKRAILNFPSFRRRFNLKAKNHQIKLEIDTGNRPVENKYAWFESYSPDDELIDDELSDLAKKMEIEFTKPVGYGSYEPDHYVSTHVVESIDLINKEKIKKEEWIPAARFSDEVERFMNDLFPKEWNNLLSEDKLILQNLAVVMEPFLKIDMDIPIPPTVGFELLALTPDGARYSQLLSWASNPENPATPRVLKYLIDFSLFIVGLQTVDCYKNALIKERIIDSIAVEKLFFTLNLTPSILSANNGEALSEILRWTRIPKNELVFEIHESCSATDAEMITILKDTWGVGLAFDDSNNLSPFVKTVLNKIVDLEKSDVKESKKLVCNTPGDVEKTIKLIKRRTQNGMRKRGFVLEGISPGSNLQFLRKNWSVRGTPLLVQGWGIQPSSLLSKPLISLEEIDGGHGFTLNPEIPQLKTISKIDTVVPLDNCNFLERRDSFQLFKYKKNPLWKIAKLDFESESHTKNLKNQQKIMERLIRDLEKENISFVVLRKNDWRNPILDKTSRLQAHSFITTTIEKFNEDIERWMKATSEVDRFIKDNLARLYQPKNWIPTEVATPTAVMEGRKFLWQWLNKGETPFAVMLGDFGIGKTFLCRMFVRELIQKRAIQPNLPVPVYIDLRNVHFVRNKDTNQLFIPTLTNLLGEVFERQELEIDASLALRAARAGRLLFIFDGIDEKVAHLTTEESNQFIQTLRSIHKDPYRDRTIMACRTHYFKNKEDESRRLFGGGGGSGFSQEGLSKGDFTRAYLLDFDETRIRAYISNILGKDKVDEIIEAMGSIYNLMDLSKRPYLLSLIIPRIHELIKRSASGDIIGAGALYELLVEEWIARDSGKHFVPPEEKPTVMGMLAHEFWLNGVTKRYYRDLGKWVTKEARRFLMEQGWIDGKRDDVDRSWADVRTAMFLVRDSEGNFTFAHRSFGEFFLARHIIDELSQNNPAILKLPHLTKEVIDFFLDLLFMRSFASHRKLIIQIICNILTSPYEKMISENAFLILVRWQQTQKPDYPMPSVIHLESADLEKINLSNCNFEEIHAEKANLVAVNLNNTIIERLYASEANFKLSLFDNSKLSTAMLQSCDFTGSKFKNSDLSDSKLNHSNMKEVEITACNMQDSDLSYVFFLNSFWRDVSARNAIFFRSDLGGTDFLKCNLENANFEKSTWIYSTAARCNLLDSTFTDVKLSHSSFVGSELKKNDVPLVVREAYNSFDRTSINSKNTLEIFLGHGNFIRSIKQIPRSEIIASCGIDHSIKLWDIKTGKIIKILKGHEDWVNSLDCSLDGRFILSGSDDKSIRLWDAFSGEMLKIYRGHEESVLAISFSWDSKYIASYSLDTTVRIWETESGDELKCFYTAEYIDFLIYNISFSDDPNIVYLYGLQLFQLNISTGEIIEVKVEKIGEELDVKDISSDGNLIVAKSPDEDSIKIIDAINGNIIRKFDSFSHPSEGFSPNGNFAVALCEDDSIGLWIRKNNELVKLVPKPGRLVSIDFSWDEKYLIITTYGGIIFVWDIRKREILNIFGANLKVISTYSFSLGGNFISCCSENNTIDIWNTNTGKLIRNFKCICNKGTSIAVSPNGKLLASISGNRTIKLWDIDTGKFVKNFKIHTAPIITIDFSPDGKYLASGSEDNTVKLLNIRTGGLVKVLRGGAEVNSVIFSPNGKLLASISGNRTIKLWDIDTGKFVKNFKIHTDSITTIDFSPDGKYLALGLENGTIRLLDIDTGKSVKNFKIHTAPIITIDFSPDGKYLASGSEDNTVRILSLRTKKLENVLKGHDTNIIYISFSKDGKFIVVCSPYGDIRFFKTSNGKSYALIKYLPNEQWASIKNNKVIYSTSDATRYLGYSLGLTRILAESIYDWQIC